MSARKLGLGHQDHPLLGKPVIDTATGRSGVLHAICPEPHSSTADLHPALRPGEGPPVAWIAPLGGGREWTTTPDAITQSGPGTTAALAQPHS